MFKAKINGVELTEQQLRDGLQQIEEQKRVPVLKAGDILASVIGPYHYIVLPKLDEIKDAVRRAGSRGHLALHMPSGAVYTCDFSAGTSLDDHNYKITGNIKDLK